jgi:ferredoxin
METHFIPSLCIECDACIDICPVDCLAISVNGEESFLRERFNAPAMNTDQPLYVSESLKQTQRVMLKDETSVCTAASAPNGVRPTHGTCGSLY